MKIALFSLLILPIAALAADFHITWDHPTERLNGANLPMSEIKGYRLYHSLNGVEHEVIDVFRPDLNTDPPLEYLLPTEGVGTYVFAVSTVDSDDLEGPKSPGLTLEIAEETYGPNAPSTINVDLSNCTNCGLREVVQ